MSKDVSPADQPAAPASPARFPGPASRVAEPESTLWQGGYSIRAMYGTWLIGALVTIAVPILLALTGWISGWRAWGYVLLGLAILWLVLLLVCAYRRFNHWYEVTNQRLKHRDGILFRRINRIELIDIDDVKYSQGPVETLLGVGSIVVESSDKSHPELTLRGIANVRHVMEMIDGARRAERIKRSVHIESV